MAIERILVVDDEALMRSFLTQALQGKNREITAVETGKKALSALKEGNFDLLITDMKLPDMTGLEVLRKAKEQTPTLAMIVITAFGSIENAVEAIRIGAFHYLIKPFTPDALEAMIAKAEEHQSLLAENQYLRGAVKAAIPTSGQIVAESPAMRAVMADALRVAKSNASVFITGESGTGKEVIAHAIHYNSLRADRPFIKVNCAAVPETLVESEFFGHEKGSFTGANIRRLGRFELANGGSLLLDEITEVPSLLQVKLLRVIQEQEFERVGGSKPIKVDVRLISTSNRDIKQAIGAKVLREDLYYRLNVVPLHVPPLRERKEDIPPLSEYFLKRFSCENHAPAKRLSQKALQRLLAYPWPGNVRELANIIERAVVLGEGEEIAADQLPLDSSSLGKKEELPSDITLTELEKRYIIETLQAKQFDRTLAAKALGITQRALAEKIQKYGIGIK